MVVSALPGDAAVKSSWPGQRIGQIISDAGDEVRGYGAVPLLLNRRRKRDADADEIDDHDQRNQSAHVVSPFGPICSVQPPTTLEVPPKALPDPQGPERLEPRVKWAKRTGASQTIRLLSLPAALRRSGRWSRRHIRLVAASACRAAASRATRCPSPRSPSPAKPIAQQWKGVCADWADPC